jgi:hypothetical protein
LVERTRATDCAGGKVRVALGAREALEDEVLEIRVIGRNIEAEVTLSALEAELDSVALLDNEARRADFEGLGRVVRALVKDLCGIGGALNVLSGQTRNDAQRKIVEEADAATDRQEIPC